MYSEPTAHSDFKLLLTLARRTRCSWCNILSHTRHMSLCAVGSHLAHPTRPYLRCYGVSSAVILYQSGQLIDSVVESSSLPETLCLRTTVVYAFSAIMTVRSTRAIHSMYNTLERCAIVSGWNGLIDCAATKRKLKPMCLWLPILATAALYTIIARLRPRKTSISLYALSPSLEILLCLNLLCLLFRDLLDFWLGVGYRRCGAVPSVLGIIDGGHQAWSSFERSLEVTSGLLAEYVDLDDGIVIQTLERHDGLDQQWLCVAELEVHDTHDGETDKLARRVFRNLLQVVVADRRYYSWPGLRALRSDKLETRWEAELEARTHPKAFRRFIVLEHAGIVALLDLDRGVVEEGELDQL